MSSPDELLPVTQADRDLAADLHHWYNGQITAAEEIMRAGHYDDDDRVQMVSRFRQSHSLPGDVGLRAIVEAEKAHWLKEAMKHKRPSGRHSDCAARDLDRAKVAQRILDKMDAALTPSPCPGDVGRVDDILSRAEIGRCEKVNRFGYGDCGCEKIVAEARAEIQAQRKEKSLLEDANGSYSSVQLEEIALTPSALSGDAGEGE